MFRAVDADHARGYGRRHYLPNARMGRRATHQVAGTRPPASPQGGAPLRSLPESAAAVSVRFSPRLLRSRSRMGTWLRSIAQAGSPRTLEELWPVDAVVRPLWPIVSKTAEHRPPSDAHGDSGHSAASPRSGAPRRSAPTSSGSVDGPSASARTYFGAAEDVCVGCIWNRCRTADG